MRRPKPTPGPWNVVKVLSDETKWATYEIERKTPLDAVAEMLGATESAIAVAEATSEADAMLIAQAPRLYELVQRLVVNGRLSEREMRWARAILKRIEEGEPQEEYYELEEEEEAEEE